MPGTFCPPADSPALRRIASKSFQTLVPPRPLIMQVLAGTQRVDPVAAVPQDQDRLGLPQAAAFRLDVQQLAERFRGPHRGDMGGDQPLGRMLRRAVARQVGRHGPHLVLAPATAVFALFLAGLHAPPVQAHYQQTRRVRRRRRADALRKGAHFRVPRRRDLSAERLRPTLHLLAVQMRSPVLVQRQRGGIKRLQRALPGQALRGPGRQRHFRRQRPIPDLRGKKNPRSGGSGRAAGARARPHAATAAPAA